MFSTRKISTFFLGISAVSMSLLTVSSPASTAGDNWPWGAPTQYSVAAEDDNWPWGRSTDDNWPWGKSTGGVSGAATPA